VLLIICINYEVPLTETSSIAVVSEFFLESGVLFNDAVSYQRRR
jgi:hypothetical protein